MGEYLFWLILIVFATGIIREAIKMWMYFTRKGIEGPANNTPVDLSPLMDGITACNTSIRTVATDTGEMKGAFNEFKAGFSEHKKHCEGRFNLLEKRTATETPVKKKLNTLDTKERA